MTNDRKIELFKRVIERIENNYFRYDLGICFVMEDMRLDPFEYMYLKLHLKANKPTISNKYKEFTENRYWRLNGKDATYWWGRMGSYPETRQIRIDYLTKLIENIK